MLNTDMKEKELNSVEIFDFDSEVVRGMLEYIYKVESDAFPADDPNPCKSFRRSLSVSIGKVFVRTGITFCFPLL